MYICIARLGAIVVVVIVVPTRARVAACPGVVVLRVTAVDAFKVVVGYLCDLVLTRACHALVYVVYSVVNLLCVVCTFVDTHHVLDELLIVALRNTVPALIIWCLAAALDALVGHIAGDRRALIVARALVLCLAFITSVGTVDGVVQELGVRATVDAGKPVVLILYQLPGLAVCAAACGAVGRDIVVLKANAVCLALERARHLCYVRNYVVRGIDRVNQLLFVRRKGLGVDGYGYGFSRAQDDLLVHDGVVLGAKLAEARVILD